MASTKEGKWNTHNNRLGFEATAVIGQLGGPREAVLAGYRVHRADDQLENDERNAIGGHRNAPVLQTVVNHEQLQRNGK